MAAPTVLPVAIAEDRSMAIPPGALVRTGYVPINAVDLACRDRMSMGDVERAYQKRLQLGDRQSWPPPRGQWAGDRFVIVDGRHEFVAALMLGPDAFAGGLGGGGETWLIRSSTAPPLRALLPRPRPTS